MADSYKLPQPDPVYTPILPDFLQTLGERDELDKRIECIGLAGANHIKIKLIKRQGGIR